MDWSLVIFVLVVMFFGYRGYRKGLQRSLSRVLSLLAGYVAAILYAPYIGSLLESNFDLKGIAALIVASLLLFFAAGMAVSILFWIIDKLTPQEKTKSSASSYAGAAIGLVVGLVLAIAIVWTIGFVRGMAPAAKTNTAAKSPTSDIEHLANQAASKAVNTAMNFGSVKPQIAKLSVALIESPVEVALSAQRLTKSNDLKNLLSDPDNQAVLNSGDVEAVKNLPAFQQLVKNPDLLALARSVGMVDESSKSPKSVETEMANQVTDIWGRMQRVQNNKRVQSILNNPEFQQKIQSGNPVDLLTNAKLLELADIIFADDAGSGSLPQQTVSDSAEPNNGQNKIYSWIDKNGKKHYSDQAPDQQ